MGRVWELPDADVEAGEGGDPEERVGEGHLPRARAVDEDELLDALGGEQTEPALELGLVRVHAGGDEVDAAEGPRVRGEGVRHGGGDGRRVGGRRGPVVQEVRVGDDERRGEPEPAPARGEHGGARGVLEGEAGDDVAEERVGEAADAVDAVGRASAAGDEAGGGGDGRVGDAAVDVRQEMLHVPVLLVLVVALAPRVGRRRGVQVGERRTAGHGRRGLGFSSRSRLRRERTN